MNRGTTDFQQLNNSVFPFERTRNIRVLVVCFEKQKVRISTDELFGWLTKMLQQITYGYGSVYGFEQKNNVFVFLIQKAADSEELFSGVYRALEEMQSSVLYGSRYLLYIIGLSSNRMGRLGKFLARKMIEEVMCCEQYGQMYTFEDEQEKKIEKEEGNLLIYRIREYVQNIQERIYHWGAFPECFILIHHIYRGVFIRRLGSLCHSISSKFGCRNC